MTRHRTEFDLHIARIQMRDRAIDRSIPAKAKITVAGCHGNARYRRYDLPGTMTVELIVAKPKCIALAHRHRFRPQDTRIERARGA